MPRLARLADRALLTVTGAEARPFLNRLLTQEVETLAVGEARFSAFLTPQGRVLHELFLWGEADGVAIDVAAREAEAMLAKLRMFRLRAAVEIAADAREVWALWGAASAPEGWAIDPRTPLAGWRRLGAPGAGADDTGDYAAHRFALGLADVAQDGLADRAYATEALLDLLNGVDYRKGCFVGQETTSRMKRRGGVRSRLLPLDVIGAAPGDEVLAGKLRAGEVVAVYGDRALALLRTDRLDGALKVRDAAAALDQATLVAGGRGAVRDRSRTGGGWIIREGLEMRVLLAFAAVAALACAPAALADAPAPSSAVMVSIGASLSAKSEAYGPDELEFLRAELARNVARRAGRGGFTRVELVLEDAVPNRPTFAMQGRYPQLSLRSLSLGGAKISGVAYGPDGARPIRFSLWSEDFYELVGAGIWTDAERAFDNLSGKLSRGEAPDRYARGEPTGRPTGRITGLGGDLWR